MKNLDKLARAIAVVQSTFAIAGCDGELVVSGSEPNPPTSSGDAGNGDAPAGNGSWETSLLTSDFDVGSLRVVAGPTGTTSVVFAGRPRYSTSDIVPDAVSAIRLVPASGWTDRETIAEGGIGAPLVALDSTSSPVVTWSNYRQDGAAAGWWSRHSVVSAWSEPAKFHEPSTTHAVFSLVSNPQDGVIALFRDGTIARFSENVGWGPVEAVASSFNAGGDVAASDEGSVVSVWHEIFLDAEGLFRNGIFARRWTARTGWSEGESLAFDVSDMSVAGNAAGQVIVIWRQWTDLDPLDPLRALPDPDRDGGLKAAWFDPTLGWGSPESIDSVPGVEGRTEVFVDSAGRALAMWQKEGGAGVEYYWAHRNSASRWTAPELLVPASPCSAPKLIGSAGGHAMVLYCREERNHRPGYRLIASRYSPEAGWTPPELVSDDAPYGGLDDVPFGGYFDVAIDDAGMAVVAWLRGTSAELVASVSR